MDLLNLLGDEAVAQGAMDAGIRGMFSYPGTPATEVFEHVRAQRPADRPILARWSVNEKSAYEEALGMSYAGSRAAVAMKHVGLNVAADPFVNSAITGAHGGLLVVVADDPQMHSSQNEQDSRFLADFAHIPCLEPSDQQEAYDMAYGALGLSEALRLPVMIRLVTRLAHSRAPVRPQPRLPQPRLPLPQDRDRFVLLPVHARRLWRQLMERWPQVEQILWAQPGNRLQLRGRELGVVAAGVAYNYLLENLQDEAQQISWLKLACYPPPRPLLRRLFEHCQSVLVLEDGYPFLERGLRGTLDQPPRPVSGRLDGSLPRTGELTPATVRQALGLPALETACAPQPDLAPRPPAMCRGCPHLDTYRLLGEALAEHGGQGRVLGDIGCYTLGALPPLEAIDATVEMGASIGMAMGAAAAGLSPAVAVIGDSTFNHSGLAPLIDAARADMDMLVVIMDNGVTAMTGYQQTPRQGGQLTELVQACGVARRSVKRITPAPKNHSQNLEVFRQALSTPGLSVIIASRACVHAPYSGKTHPWS